MEKEQIDVLLVEDDEDDYFITKNLLSKANSVHCNLDWVRSYESGLQAAVSGSYDVCLVDYRLGKHDGLHLMRQASERGCHTPMILLTGQGDLEVDLSAMMAGAADYLVKSKIDADLLERSIRYARERQRAEERIREQAQLLDKARDAISAYSIDGRVIYWNKSAERLTGWSYEDMRELSAQQAFDRLYGQNDEALDKALDTVKEEGEWMGELTVQTSEGEERIVESRWSLVRDADGQPSSILIINTDISERKQLEQQFLRSQRMESIGRLVGGIAHDLGNLLVPVLLGVEVLEQRFTDDEKAKRTLSMIQKSASRGSEMVKQVLSFARGVEGERVALELQPIIEEVERITEETFPSTIDVQTRLPDDLWKIKGDATQVQQVLVNLCMNARDAMPDGGELRVEARNVTFEDGSSLLGMEAESGRYVCITVDDTGEGIDPDDLDKIFEPFFTTKPTGEGTGLGLSTVYSIVKSHGGFIDVNSQPGVGTSFAVHLPMADGEAEGPDELPDDVTEGQGEVVLVVDDEPFIVETTQDMLERAGYEVLTASNGREGLNELQAREGEIQAVITDLVMPEMSGSELIRHLQSTRSELPIIVISSPADNQKRDALEMGADRFLSKPFTAQHLCVALHRLLHETESRPEVA